MVLCSWKKIYSQIHKSFRIFSINDINLKSTAVSLSFWEILFLNHLQNFLLLSLNLFYTRFETQFFEKKLDTKIISPSKTSFQKSAHLLTSSLRRRRQYLTPTAWNLINKKNTLRQYRVKSDLIVFKMKHIFNFY